jgi:5'-nucleotidase
MMLNQHLPKRWSLWAMLLAFATTLSAQNDSNFQLQILHNNDGESKLFAGDDGYGGAAQFLATINALRFEAFQGGYPSILLSSGDNFIPGPEIEASLALADSEAPYDAQIFTAFNYDAIAIGNHDFDLGPDFLARVIRGTSPDTRFPVFLSANLDVSGEPALAELAAAGRLAESTILFRANERIGVIGLTTTNLPFISSPRNVEVLQDLVAETQEEIDELKARGINKIILISHLQGIEEEIALISELQDIDIVIAGGGDDILANNELQIIPGDVIEGTYPLEATDAAGETVFVVTTGGDYRYLGNLTVTFDAAGEVIEVDEASGPVPVIGKSNPTVESLLDPVNDFVSGLDEAIIASTEVALDGRRNSVRGLETNQGNLIADALLWQARQLASEFDVPMADVALANGGGIRNNNVIAAGTPISVGTTFDMLPFGNITSVLEVSAAQFKLIVENAVSRITADGPTGGGTGRFAQIAGFTMEYDFNQTPLAYDGDAIVEEGSRVVTITLADGTKIVENGQVVSGARDIVLVLPDFLARGGDQYPVGDAAITLLGLTGQRSLQNYIEQELGGTISAAQYPESGEGRITQVEADFTGNEEDFTIQILHNNDGESNLFPSSDGYGGAAQFLATINALRFDAFQGGYPSILLSSGDNFIPGPEIEASLSLSEDEIPYDAQVFSAFNYDAIALGNHDFDLGPDFLARIIEGTDPGERYPVFLSANLDFSEESALAELEEAGRLAESTIVFRGTERIGVIGLTTPNLPFISSPRNVEVLDDLVAETQAEIDELKARDINKIILISHLQGIEEEIALISELQDIDIVIAGGGDDILANDESQVIPGDIIEGTYPLEATDAAGETVFVVTTGGDYRYLGNLTVTFDSEGVVTAIDEASGPVPVIGKSNPEVEDILAPVADFIEALETTVIATTEVALDGRRNSVRGVETNQGNLIADALLWQARELAEEFDAPMPDVALANGGGIRNNNVIDAGSDITVGTTFDMLPFGNITTILSEILPETFKLVLENAVSRITAEGPTGGGTGRFAQIAGFSFEYDLNGDPLTYDGDNISNTGSRIINVTLDDGTVIVANGEVVDGAPEIVVVTPDFLARGGDQYPYGEVELTLLGVTGQSSLQNYIEEELNGVISTADYPEGGEGRITQVTGNANNLPETRGVAQPFVAAFPNPTTDVLNVRYEVVTEGTVQLSLTDVHGRRVATLVQENALTGTHIRQVDVDSLSSGVYFLTIQTTDEVKTIAVQVQ